MNKASLSERDICTKYIPLVLRRHGWNLLFQLREEFEDVEGALSRAAN